MMKLVLSTGTEIPMVEPTFVQKILILLVDVLVFTLIHAVIVGVVFFFYVRQQRRVEKSAKFSDEASRRT